MNSWGKFHDIGVFPWRDGLCQIAHSHRLLSDNLTLGRFFVIIRYSFPPSEQYYHQLFYCSSGSNTHERGSWFPCDGYCIDWTGEEVFVKLTSTHFSQNLKKDTKLISKIKGCGIDLLQTTDFIQTGLLLRLGAPIFVFITRILGGGLWKHDKLKNILLKAVGIDTDPCPPDHTTVLTEIDPQTTALKIHEMDPQTITLEMCNYTQYAVSINNVPQEYPYCNPFLETPRVNLKKWIEGPVVVGEEITRKFTKLKEETETLYIGPIQGVINHRAIPIEFVSSFDWRMQPAWHTKGVKQRCIKRLEECIKKQSAQKVVKKAPQPPPQKRVTRSATKK